jgi:hypothetical protein
MPRKTRLFVPGATYHVYCRVARGEFVFENPDNAEAVAVGRFGHRVCDLAKLLRKNPGTVSRWLTEASRRSLSDPSYRTHLDILDSRIQEFSSPKVIK